MAELSVKVRDNVTRHPLRSSCISSMLLLLVMGLEKFIIVSVFSRCMPVKICCAACVLQSCNTKLTNGVAFVEFSVLLVKSKNVPNFRFLFC